MPGSSPTPVHSPTLTFTPTKTFTPTFTVTETPVSSCLGTYSAGTNFTLSTTGVFNNYGSIFCSPITMTVTGRVTVLHYYSGAAGNNVSMALYTDNGGAPYTLITKSTPQAAVSGINNVDVPDTGDLAPGVYWVVVRPDSGSNLNLYEEYTGAGGSYWMNDGSGDFPATSTGGSAQDYDFAFWADYCVMSGSPTPVRTATWTYTPSFTPTPTATNSETPSCSSSYSFGRNYTPSGAVSTGLNDGTYFSKYTLPVDGKVSQLHAYIIAANGDSFSMGLYSNSGSAPGTLITSSGTQTAVDGWNSFSVPGTSLLPAGTYWIAAATNSPSTALYFADDDWSVDSDPSDGYIQGFELLPSTFSGSGPNQYSFYFYADYCVLGSSPTPVHSPTQTFTPTLTFTLTPTVTETPACNPGSTLLGKTSPGGSGGFGGYNLLATRYVLSTAGEKVIKLNYYVASMPTPVATYDVRMGLYNDNSGVPGTLISQSSVQQAHLGYNVVDIPDTGVLSAPATYWIALIHDNNAYQLDIRYDNTGLTDGYFAGSSFGSLPSPFPSGNPEDWTFTFYATTCP